MGLLGNGPEALLTLSHLINQKSLMQTLGEF